MDDWVSDLLQAGPLAAQAVKEAALQSLDLPLPQAFRTRYRAEERRLNSSEAAEGVAAFVEHRAPAWVSPTGPTTRSTS